MFLLALMKTAYFGLRGQKNTQAWALVNLQEKSGPEHWNQATKKTSLYISTTVYALQKDGIIKQVISWWITIRQMEGTLVVNW